MDKTTDFHVDDCKTDEAVSESVLTNLSHKQSPRSSPCHVNTNLKNNNNTIENLSSNEEIGPNDNTNDNDIPSTHSIIHSLPTASVPIPFQAMQTDNQQQQMLLYQQQREA